MCAVGLLSFSIRAVARLCNRVGLLAQDLAFFLDNLLPALLPPSTLTRSIAGHYAHTYELTPSWLVSHAYEWQLDAWEQQVADRYLPRHARVLVLGAGIGRESIPLALSGRSVIGIDIDRRALRFAREGALRLTKGADFLQADFYRLPFTDSSFDALLLFGIMYSAMPGRRARQAWLRSSTSLLREAGCLVLCFLTEPPVRSRSRRLSDRINGWLCRLPGSNHEYQPGDTCGQSHFLHAFQDEQELRQEMGETGLAIVELNWGKGYAVLARSELRA